MNWFVRLAGLACVLPMCGALAATPADIDAARINALAYLVQSQKGTGNWSTAGGLETQATAAVLEALQNAGFSKGGNYSAALAWLSNAAPSSVEGAARKVMALKAAGRDVSAPLDQLLGLKNAADRYTWGAYAGFETGFPDTPLALSALKAASGGYPDTNQLATSVYCEILPAQRPDGGWAYGKPPDTAPVPASAGAVIPTAYVLIELAAVKAAKGWDSDYSCGPANNSLSAALINGKAWLLGKRNADGGFGDSGSSGILETALAYRAVQTTDPANAALVAAQDYLVTGAGKPQANGSWADDPLQTALVLRSFPAIALADDNRDGLPDAVQAALGAVGPAATRALLAGNGQAQAGVNRAALLATARLNQAFAYALAPRYAGPFGFAGGILPDGLSLDAASGTISGTPTRLGTFNFSFTAAGSVVEAQISVAITAPYRLTVAYSGMGSVTGSPGGIDCGQVCDQSYAAGAAATLVAGTPGPGYVFTGWSGDCAGTSTTCTLVMTTDKTATANFFSRQPRSSWKRVLGKP